MKRIKGGAMVFALALIVVSLLVSGLLLKEIFSTSTLSESAPSNTGSISAPARVCDRTGDSYKLPNLDLLLKSITNDPLRAALPNDGAISVRLFHWYDDCRWLDRSYLITRENIQESSELADLIVWIESPYVAAHQDSDLCSIIKGARALNKISTEFSLSKTALSWKYRGLLEYRSCFGL